MISFLPGKSVALQRAEAIAAILCESRHTRRINLFGSISYLGDGRDIDLVVYVSDADAIEFFASIAEELAEPDYYNTKMTRLRAAMAILNLEEHWRSLLDLIECAPRETAVDIFLFPEDWRTNQMVQILNKRFPEFLSVISQQIKRYNVGRRAFDGLGFWRTNFGKYMVRGSRSTWMLYKWLFKKVPVQLRFPI